MEVDKLTNESLELLHLKAAGLLFYQTLWQTLTGEAFIELLHVLQTQTSPTAPAIAYSKWFNYLAATGLNWQDWLLRSLLESDNPFTRRSQLIETIDQLPSQWLAAVRQDLRSLQVIYQMSETVLSQVGLVNWIDSASECTTEFMPEPLSLLQTFAQAEDWGECLPELVGYYRQNGVGIFGQYWAFRWLAGELRGIATPDPIQLESLVGYELPKVTLVQNTEALLKGLPALHVLLYGSRGTGKSSLVKALLTEYGRQGLRLVEVGKADLTDLPLIVDRLRHLPQKFIIFVDDLSFEEDDDAYKSLKVVLEGSLTARSPNLVVYATSNRRHLIREFYGDRPRPQDADEIHAWDTMQEKLSFSDRFGLTLTFEPADQDTYLTIVFHLAQQAGITLESEDLQFQALQWATRHNGRSGRTARQFVDFLVSSERSSSYS
jgi:uncharacterized protein